MRAVKKIGHAVGMCLFLWTLIAGNLSFASEPMTWTRAIDRDDASALRHLMPDHNVFDTNEKGKSALMSAARLGDLELLESLRARGLTLTDRSNTGGTSLMYAALGNQLSMVRFIDAAVDSAEFLDAQSTNGWTALMIAAAKGFDQTVSLLVELGANPSLADGYQWSPLMRAIDNHHASVMRYLVSLSQVDINAVNENGSTALHIAVLKQDVEAVTHLLNRSELRTDITDKNGLTALGVAIERDEQEIAAMIQRAASQ